MKNVNRRSTSAVKYPRSKRNHPIMHISSTMPGVAHPIAFIPMFREDSLVGAIKPMVEMLETKELFMNRVSARFTAWVVPFLALDRFNGSRDEFDRSYMGEASLNGDGVIPFVQNAALPTGGVAAVPLLLALGAHGNTGDLVNTAYWESYNIVYNHRARQKSRKLTPRALDDKTLAPAFWNHSQFPHMVADFDQAMIDGQVALNVVQSKMPLKTDAAAGANLSAMRAGEIRLLATNGNINSSVTAGTETSLLYTEMAANGITISLAGLEEARKLQAFAKLRTQFEGHDDEWITDMLMQGLSVPDQHLKQPFQILDQTVYFEQGKRFSSTAGSLDDSATSGFVEAMLRLRVPQINTGGTVVVLMEILPEQLWERQKDWFLHAKPDSGRAAHDFWPDAERDTLDREKVDVVYNGDIDVSHADPTAYFAFDPMNSKYNRASPTVGGKFHRPNVDTLVDDARRRFWAVEGANPTLTDSFFIVEPGTMHIKGFLDETSDPFEISAPGNCVLDGLTQFGGLLIEATGNYDKVAESAPTDQIVKEETP